MNTNKIFHSDALHILKDIDSDSIDLIVTDPPYGYSFMNKNWDKAVVSVETWKECLRVMKSGAFAFIMSSPRQDVLCKMILNLIDAGFETNFTSIYWTYASGFPKAANTSKLIQKRGLEKEELNGSYLGFQPKPALETILVVMKPLSEKSFVDQALKNGKGCTWLDDCRIPFQNENDLKGSIVGHNKGWSSDNSNEGWKRNGHKDYFIPSPNDKGRFPANLIVSDDALNDGKIRKGSPVGFKGELLSPEKGWNNHNMKRIPYQEYNDSGSYSRYFDLDAWYDAQFIITPKASPSERGTDNKHPTVKPLKLMSYLITMGSRENDIILDPFCGSGTTCIAAYQLNRRFIGIEKEIEYVEIANKRLEPYMMEKKITDY